MSKVHSPFFQLLSEADKIEVKEVQEPPLTPTGEKVFVVKIQPPAKSPFSQSEQEIQSQAELLLQNQEYLLARNCFSFLLRKNVKNEVAMYGLGQCFFHLKEFESAKKCFKTLWELFKKSEYGIRLGICLMEQGNSLEAELVFSKIDCDSEVNIPLPLKFDFEKHRGNLCMERKQWDEAEFHYKNAEVILPESAAIQINLGALALQKKDLVTARLRYGKALERDQKNSRALCGLALVELEERQTQEAVRLLKSSVSEDPFNTMALLCLTQLDLTQSETNQLIEQLKNCIKHKPSQGEIRFQLARLLMEQKHFGESYEEAEQALKYLPGDSRILSLKKILIQNRHRGQA